MENWQRKKPPGADTVECAETTVNRRYGPCRDDCSTLDSPTDSPDEASSTTLRRLIGNKQIEAKQVISGGPWEIDEVEVEKWKSRVDRPLTLKPDKQESLFSNTQNKGG